MRYISIVVFLLGAVQNSFCQIEDYPYLTNFYSSECDSLIFSKDSVKSTLTSFRRYENGSINIRLTVGDNCGAVQNGILEVRGDTLNLSYDGKKSFITKVFKGDSIETKVDYVIESYAFCDCLFELTYEIQGNPEVNYVYLANDQVVELIQE